MAALRRGGGLSGGAAPDLSTLKVEARDFQAALPDLDESVYEVLGVRRAVAAMTSYGSTAPDQVRRQVESWKKRLHGE